MTTTPYVLDRSKQRTRQTCATKGCGLTYLTGAYDPQPLCRPCRLEGEAHHIASAIEQMQNRQAALIRESRIVRERMESK